MRQWSPVVTGSRRLFIGCQNMGHRYDTGIETLIFQHFRPEEIITLSVYFKGTFVFLRQKYRKLFQNHGFQENKVFDRMVSVSHKYLFFYLAGKKFHDLY